MDKKSSSSSDNEFVTGESKVDFAVNLVSRQLKGIFGQASRFTKSASESCVFKQMNWKQASINLCLRWWRCAFKTTLEKD